MLAKLAACIGQFKTNGKVFLNKGRIALAVLEVTLARDVISSAQLASKRRTQYGVDLLGCPYVVATFFALAVSIKCGIKASSRRGHFAINPANSFFDHGGVEWILRIEPSTGISIDQQSIVVEHLLEVRYQPVGIYAVAGKATAKLIEQAAVRHCAESNAAHFINPRSQIRPGRWTKCSQEIKRHGGREFRCFAEATILIIVVTADALRGFEQTLGIPIARGSARASGLSAREDVFLNGLGVFDQFALRAFIKIGDAHANLWPRNKPLSSVFGGEVGATEKRSPIGQAKNVKRPTTLLLNHLHSLHIDLVNVGTLFAVDLHTNEVFIHDPSNVFVLKTLVRHDVTPVTRGITD